MFNKGSDISSKLTNWVQSLGKLFDDSQEGGWSFFWNFQGQVIWIWEWTCHLYFQLLFLAFLQGSVVDKDRPSGFLPQVWWRNSIMEDPDFHVPVCESEERRAYGKFQAYPWSYPLKTKLFIQNLDFRLLPSGFCQALEGDIQPNVVFWVGKVVNLNTKHLSLLWAPGYLRVYF